MKEKLATNDTNENRCNPRLNGRAGAVNIIRVP